MRRFRIAVFLAAVVGLTAFGSQQGASQTVRSTRPAAEAGVLAGVRVAPRRVARLARDAGFSGNNLFIAVAVAGGESWLWSRAHSDNTRVITLIPNGTEVRNVETGEPTIVVNAAAGTIKLSDGEIVNVPLTVRYVISRDVGLWEISIPASQIGTNVERALYNPGTNAVVAYHLWRIRGWQPWAAYNSGSYLSDTYRQWAAVGVANLWMLETNADAASRGIVSRTRIPWISIPELRKLYPSTKLG